MGRFLAIPLRVALLITLTVPLLAQRSQAPAQSNTERFFSQLRSLFGRFRDGDLQRAFDTANPIRCSDLVSGGGDWHPVAFFNEDRRLGDWYHGSLEEVNGDLALYTFQGSCATDESSLQLISKEPIKESLDRYLDNRIRFDQIKVNVNPPVRASFSARTQTYQFDLPYLYAVRGRTTRDVMYSLIADHADDHYASNVIDEWDCKSVRGNDLTFQFLICDTWAGPPNVARAERVKSSFGAAAYFILSDGKEALTSVRLSFGDGNDAKVPAPAPATAPEPVVVDRAPDTDSVAGWQIPSPATKLAGLDRTEFRVRFAQTWAGKIGSPQLLSGQKISTLDPLKSPTGIDYCAWRPSSANLAPRVLGNEPDADVDYALRVTDTSVTVEMKTHNGARLGLMQCYFPGTETEEIPFSRWTAVAGNLLTLEVRP